MIYNLPHCNYVHVYSQQSHSIDSEVGEAASPAVSILQSTERVAKVITGTLSEDEPSFAISRPNLGKYQLPQLRQGAAS